MEMHTERRGGMPTKIIGSTIGERLRRQRLDLDWTQERLAEESGVPQTHLSSLEHGRIADMKTETLKKLATALGVSTDWLLGLDTQRNRRGTRKRRAMAAG
jgi:transcriptional regulator with XRE-family HTH domain